MSSVGNGVEPVVKLWHTEETEQQQDSFHKHSSNHLQKEEIDDEKCYFVYVLIKMHKDIILKTTDYSDCHRKHSVKSV